MYKLSGIKMATELDILKSVCQSLENANIPYMLTGSFAANFYAIPRMTRDIDFVLEIYKFDVSRLYKAFQNDFYIDKDSIIQAIEHQGMFNIIHNDSIIKIDFIIRKDLPYRNTEFERRRKIKIDNEEIWIVSPEDLIISKLFWAKDSFSEMQIKDVKNLMGALNNLDKGYIEKWINLLKLDHVYERLKQDA